MVILSPIILRRWNASFEGETENHVATKGRLTMRQNLTVTNYSGNFVNGILDGEVNIDGKTQYYGFTGRFWCGEGQIEGSYECTYTLDRWSKALFQATVLSGKITQLSVTYRDYKYNLPLQKIFTIDDDLFKIIPARCGRYFQQLGKSYYYYGECDRKYMLANGVGKRYTNSFRPQ